MKINLYKLEISGCIDPLGTPTLVHAAQLIKFM